MDVATPVKDSKIREQGDVRGEGTPRATPVTERSLKAEVHRGSVGIPGSGLAYLGYLRIPHVACLTPKFLRVPNSTSSTSLPSSCER